MSSRKGNSIIASDCYPTPTHVVDAILSQVDFREGDIFLEPCRGVERRIYDRVALPTDNKKWAELAEDVDYLNTSFKDIDIIITNPPFSLSCEFIEKCLSELKDDGTLIFLQRVNFLGSIKRVDFWEKNGLPHKQVTLVPRPKFALNGTDSCEYAFFIYDKGNRTSRINSPISVLVTEQDKLDRHRAREQAKLLKSA